MLNVRELLFIMSKERKIKTQEIKVLDDSSQGFSLTAMPIIADKVNIVASEDEENTFEVEYLTQPECPDCMEPMVQYDSRRRICKLYEGQTNHLIVCRFECRNKNCQCGVITVLPPVSTPYKWYATEVIQDVIDEVITPETSESADLYPCERTIKRWKKWYSINKNQIDGMFKTVGSRIEGFGEELLNSTESIIDQLKDRLSDMWLTAVNAFSCQFRISLLRESPMSLYPPALSRFLNLDDVPLLQEVVKHHGKAKLAGRRSTEEISDDHSASG